MLSRPLSEPRQRQSQAGAAKAWPPRTSCFLGRTGGVCVSCTAICTETIRAPLGQGEVAQGRWPESPSGRSSLLCPAGGATPSRAHPGPRRSRRAPVLRPRARRDPSSWATAGSGGSPGCSARGLPRGVRPACAGSRRLRWRCRVRGGRHHVDEEVRQGPIREPRCRDRGETKKPWGDRHSPGPSLPLVPARKGRENKWTLMQPPSGCQQENQ
jgi:hypothetical protein